MKAGARPRALPRRRKPNLAARVLPFWLLGAVVAALLVWAGVWLAHATWFRVARVGIDVPVASPVSRDRVRAAASLQPDVNVWLVDPRAIARRVEAIPYADVATVHRGQFPQPFVEIGITVRRPAACVRAGAREVTLDATARVLQDGCALPSTVRIDAGHASLPRPGAYVNDPAVGQLLGDEKELAAANLTLRALRRDRFGGLEAVDVTGVVIRFGEDEGLAAKAALVGPVRAGVGKRRIRAIDLRAPSTPTVEFAP